MQSQIKVKRGYEASKVSMRGSTTTMVEVKQTEKTPLRVAAKGERNVVDLRAGDWVEVKSPAEIAETLDADGTLDGLPFMPEMLEYCGRRFRVQQHIEKCCVEEPLWAFFMRSFPKKDVLFLEEVRCSGSAHDGCQRLCMIFWKAAWLRAVETGGPAKEVNRRDLGRLESRLKTKSAPGKYFCQSTRLPSITLDHKRSVTISQAVRDLRSGAVSVPRMFLLLLIPLLRRIRHRYFGRPRLLGSLTKTEVGNLNLQPGELVRIKSLKEMQATLDRHGKNRGLICDIEIGRFSGQVQKVVGRLDRIICENTGEMRTVGGTVILDRAPCICGDVFAGCPRRDYVYFRELWLERVNPAKDGTSKREA